MYVLIGFISLFIEEASSLKDRRRVVRSIVDSLRVNFKVSSAIVGDDGDWHTAGVGFSAVSGDRRFLIRLKDDLFDYIESHYPGRCEERSAHIENVRDLSA